MERPSDEEIKEFLEEYEDRIPDPTHYPKCFMYYWNLFKYTKERRSHND
jgi:hypothetical protein